MKQFYRYFDEQSSLKSFINKHNFPCSLQNFRKKVKIVKVVQNFSEGYRKEQRNARRMHKNDFDILLKSVH